MNRHGHRGHRKCLPRAQALLGVLLLLGAPLLPSNAAERSVQPTVVLTDASAEIHFPAPKQYAVVAVEPEHARRLYGAGEVIFHLQDPTHSLSVERVRAGALLVRAGPKGRLQWIRAGQPLPGLPGLVLVRTVALDQVQYRYRTVEHILHSDPVLVAVSGARAILEVEVQSARSSPPATVPRSHVSAAAATDPPPSDRTRSEARLVEKVRVREVSPGSYEVSAADIQPLLESPGRALADLGPLVLPVISVQAGLQYRITSAASDGVMGAQGFTVQDPKMASRAGIEAGDTILSVNGQPVDGFGSLFQIYQDVRRDPTHSTIQVELERQGTRLTKTYRIR